MEARLLNHASWKSVNKSKDPDDQTHGQMIMYRFL
jgi:hypothetical protein